MDQQEWLVSHPCPNYDFFHILPCKSVLSLHSFFFPPKQPHHTGLHNSAGIPSLFRFYGKQRKTGACGSLEDLIKGGAGPAPESKRAPPENRVKR